MKKHASTIILSLVFLAGLSLLLYPSVSNYWNSMHQTQMIGSYLEQVTQMDDTTYQDMENAALKYNRALAERGTDFSPLEEEQWEEYVSLLDVTGTGIMGYVDIPSIRCNLPIYHGTDEGVLEVAVGHLEWSSLPVGGASSHAVVSGHRGLPSARLFTDIDQLAVGDIFQLNILGDTLTYEVDQILIVLPNDMDSLKISEGEDYCTLVTCTPYAVNTHRLLVRGHRVENAEDAGDVRVLADAIQIDKLLVAPFVAMPVLLLLLLMIL